MKKFKFKSEHNNIYHIIIIILLFIVFVVLSFTKLNKSNSKLISLMLDNNISLNLITSNLDNLILNYSFQEKNEIYLQNSKKIYLYNTHNLENYNDGTSIYEATTLLKNNLNKLGMDVILEDKKTSELLHTGLSYYDISRSFLIDVMNMDKTINYYIDIHRDSVSNTTITINNKPYAKIMFVLGLENNNYEKNKIIISKMNDYLNTNYLGISRGIYEKKGNGVDGIYNQDLSDKVLLIEIGGVENTYQEINNSTEIISLLLYHMIGDMNENF